MQYALKLQTWYYSSVKHRASTEAYFALNLFIGGSAALFKCQLSGPAEPSILIQKQAWLWNPYKTQLIIIKT